MLKLPGSVAARLVISYGLQGIVAMVAVSSVFYFGTVGVLHKNIDEKLLTPSQRFASETPDELAEKIRRQ
ncbi:hypothetical protein Q4S45_08535 [Massilia sp. R2A-15]|uniref:hypothetical protein n=1 Tax=Massilia sp. R2A-15 TaxID=3064278 RepID=UPI0027323D0C|nr:hypothetical protein [Massilia sp. R2A-15]WLI91152.1 hypothetical protein Q4S45_08535 [Massilia sp. R2A-15]